MTRTFI